MKLKFTNTTWKVDDNLKDDRGNTIYQITTEVTYDGKYTYEGTIAHVEEYAEVPNWNPDREADARLISAAPDLLNALILMKSTFCPGEDWQGTSICNIVEAALNKALGE